MSEVVVKLFDTPELNDIGKELIRLDDEYAEHMKEAKDSLFSAFRTRWVYGKIISENIDLILDECGTQKNFANKLGKSEGVVSNNKRGYEYLKEAGCETWDDVIKTLKHKQITPSVSNFEKIGTLLNEPNRETSKKEQIHKDRRRLEQLRGEIEEILQRNEPGTQPDIIRDAFEFIEDVKEITDYLDSFQPERTGWKSEKYLDFVRNYGFDVITGEPTERCDPHHTTPSGGTGPEGEKLPDYYAIPVSRRTHRLMQSGRMEVSPESILRAQFTTLTSFLTLNMK